MIKTDRLKRVLGVAIIIENPSSQVLLQLREDKPDLPFANHWTLPGGTVERSETPAQAAHRELREETGLELPLTHWKVYERQHRNKEVVIEQNVFKGFSDKAVNEMFLGEEAELRFVAREDIPALLIAYGFDALLVEYFSMRRHTTI